MTNPFISKTRWDWEIDPIGFRYLLNELNDRYQIPLMIIENGIGTLDELTEDKQVHDQERIDFLSFRELSKNTQKLRTYVCVHLLKCV